jgi:excisionase family DNA binding protein
MTSVTGSLDDQKDHPSGLERLMSPLDIARFLGVPLRTIYRWRSRGEGPRGYRVGRHVRYRARDVEHWLEHHRDAS